MMHGLAAKPRIAAAKYEALHTLPARMEGNPRADQMAVIFPAHCIEQVHRCDVAFAALCRCDTTHAADGDRARRKGLSGNPLNDGVERHAMAAHEIGRASCRERV